MNWIKKYNKCLTLLLVILSFSCNKPIDKVYKGLKLSDINNYMVVNFITLSTSKLNKEKKLSDAQIKTLKNLVCNIENHKPIHQLKKCWFEPDFEFKLKNQKQKDLRIQICLRCQTWKFIQKEKQYLGNCDNAISDLKQLIENLIL